MDGEEVFTDVLIAGAGPTGYMAATTLARYGISFCAIDKRPQHVQTGHASGVQPRSQEILHTLGLRRDLEPDSNRSYENALWEGGSDGKLKRSNIGPEANLRCSFPWLMIIAQNFTEAAFDNDLRSRGIEIERSIQLIGVSHDDHPKNPIKVTAKHLPSGNTIVYRAKYVLACDGARSAVNRILGSEYESHGGIENWGVADCETESNFPDIRRRTPIRSPNGDLHLIPNPGSANRVYTQLSAEDAEVLQKDQETNSIDKVTNNALLIKIMQEKVDAVMIPYKLKLGRVKWVSRYNVAQRMLNTYVDKSGRIFSLGDACHSHSPKAAQGMNTGLSDAFNMTWKLALVLKGLAKPELLKTYEIERKQVGKELIDLDLELGKQLGAAKDGTQMAAVDLSALWKLRGGFISGLLIRYRPGGTTLTPALTLDGKGNPAGSNTSAVDLTPGTIIRTPQVIRQIDGAKIDLIDDLPSFGRFRLLALVGDKLETGSADDIWEHLDARDGLLKRFNRREASANGSIGEDPSWAFVPESYLHRRPAPANVKAGVTVELLVLHTGDHLKLDTTKFHRLIHTWKWRVYEDKDGVFHGDCGINKDKGALVLIRPDGYIAYVGGLGEDGLKGAESVLDSVLV